MPEVVIVGAGPVGILLGAELTRGGVDALVLERRAGVGAASRAIGLHAPALVRAHRGLFVVHDVARTRRGEGDGDEPLALRDLWSGARFVATGLEPGTDDALAFAEGALDARVVVEERAGGTPRFAAWVLPGAVYHPPEALPLLEPLLAEAEARGLGKGAALDALLRMELAHRKATRMKVAYAYRAAAFAPPSPPAPGSSGRLPLSGKWAMR